MKGPSAWAAGTRTFLQKWSIERKRADVCMIIGASGTHKNMWLREEVRRARQSSYSMYKSGQDNCYVMFHKSA